MLNIIPIPAVSEVVTCQIGNTTDMTGFKRNHLVEVLEVQERQGEKVFLIVDKENPYRLGVAALPNPDAKITDILHCPVLYTYGPGLKFETVRDLITHFGFY